MTTATIDDTIDVEDRGETISVPTTFERSELATWYGSVPDEIRVDRIFRYDGILRAIMHVEGENWVEVGYFRDDDFRPGTETGWVAEHINAPEDDGLEPGETLWTRD